MSELNARGLPLATRLALLLVCEMLVAAQAASKSDLLPGLRVSDACLIFSPDRNGADHSPRSSMTSCGPCQYPNRSTYPPSWIVGKFLSLSIRRNSSSAPSTLRQAP